MEIKTRSRLSGRIRKLNKRYFGEICDEIERVPSKCQQEELNACTDKKFSTKTPHRGRHGDNGFLEKHGDFCIRCGESFLTKTSMKKHMKENSDCGSYEPPAQGRVVKMNKKNGRLPKHDKNISAKVKDRKNVSGTSKRCSNGVESKELCSSSECGNSNENVVLQPLEPSAHGTPKHTMSRDTMPVYMGKIDVRVEQKQLFLNLKGYRTVSSETSCYNEDFDLSDTDGGTSSYYIPSRMNIESQPVRVIFSCRRILIEFSLQESKKEIDSFQTNDSRSTPEEDYENRAVIKGSKTITAKSRTCLTTENSHENNEETPMTYPSKRKRKMVPNDQIRESTKPAIAVPEEIDPGEKAGPQNKSDRQRDQWDVKGRNDSGAGRRTRPKSVCYVARFGKDISIEKVGEKVHYKCKKCEITCFSQEAMKNHIRSKTHNTFPCQLCPSAFHSRPGLLRHTRLHSGEKSFQCEICGKSFSCKTSLNSHKLSHSKEKPHLCDVCGKGFTNTGDLHKHVRIHTGEKNYQCEACGMSFTHRSTLRRHATLHTGHRPFKCDTCGKSYATISELKRHNLSHTGERRFECKTCGKAYFTTSHLFRHQKTCSRKTDLETCDMEEKQRTDVETCDMGEKQKTDLETCGMEEKQKPDVEACGMEEKPKTDVETCVMEKQKTEIETCGMAEKQTTDVETCYMEKQKTDAETYHMEGKQKTDLDTRGTEENQKNDIGDTASSEFDADSETVLPLPNFLVEGVTEKEEDETLELYAIRQRDTEDMFFYNTSRSSPSNVLDENSKDRRVTGCDEFMDAAVSSDSQSILIPILVEGSNDHLVSGYIGDLDLSTDSQFVQNSDVLLEDTLLGVSNGVG